MLQKGDNSKNEITAWCHYFLAVVWYKNKKYLDCAKEIVDCLTTYQI